MAGTPREEFAARLGELFDDAEMTLGAAEQWARSLIPPIKLGRSKLSQWVNGTNVPSAAQEFALLIQELEKRAEQKSSRRRQGVPHWELLRSQAATSPRDGAEQAKASSRGRTGASSSRKSKQGLPCQVGDRPRRATAFQHRPEAALLSPGLAATEAGPVPSVVLTGMAGVGKTQLAAEYVRSVEQDLDVLVWVTATSRASIVAAYAEAAVTLCGADPSDPERAARMFLKRLNAPGQQVLRWLVVLDTLADPAHLNHRVFPSLLPDASTHGHVLITTWRREAPSFPAEYIQVEVPAFGPETAQDYLHRYLSQFNRHESPEELSALAADLEYLPLALAQAAAYVVTAGISCDDYRRRLAQKKLAVVLPDPSAMPDGQSVTVDATWALCLEYANRLRPAGLAEPMLNLAAMLAPEGIPQAVLQSGPARTFLTASAHSMETADEPAVLDVDDCADALRALHRLSLLDYDPTDSVTAVRVHQLVQRSTRESLAPERLQACARAAAKAVCEVWHERVDSPPLAEAMRSNALALIKCAKDALWMDYEAREVLSLPGASFYADGYLTAAAAYFKDLVAEAEPRLGHEHKQLRRFRLACGRAQRESGDTQGAEATLTILRDQLTALLQSSPGSVDLDEYADASQELARAQGFSGSPETARDTLLALQQMLEGEGFPPQRTLGIRHDYALWLLESNQTSAARKVYEQVLEDKLSLLGSEDPETHMTQFELARTKLLMGEVAGAAADLAELLPKQQRLLGASHPETLKTMEEAVRARAVAEQDPRIAADGLAEALAIRLRTQEPTDPWVLHTRMDRIMWRHWANTCAESPDREGTDQAIEELRRLLADMDKALSPGDPIIRRTRHYLRELRRFKRHADKLGPAEAARRMGARFTITTVHRGLS